MGTRSLGHRVSEHPGWWGSECPGSGQLSAPGDVQVVGRTFPESVGALVGRRRAGAGACWRPSIGCPLAGTRTSLLPRSRRKLLASRSAETQTHRTRGHSALPCGCRMCLSPQRILPGSGPLRPFLSLPDDPGGAWLSWGSDGWALLPPLPGTGCQLPHHQRR